MDYLPIFLDLRGKNSLVVGGGDMNDAWKGLVRGMR